MHSRLGLAKLDEGRPFNILSNGHLFNQCGASQSSKQLVGRTAMLPIIHAGTERGKRSRRSSPRGSHSRIAATARRPGKGGRKDQLAVDPMEAIALDGPEKLTYVSTLLSSEEKEQL